MPLPILESTEFDRRWSEVLRETSPGAELSRLVVKPEYRGLGISRDLVRAVLAKSIEMRRRVVLLECIPTHEDMYKKYGFRRMDGDPHSRPTDLDQYAIAMWIKFDDQSALADNLEILLGKLSLGLNPRFGPIDTQLPGDVRFRFEPVVWNLKPFSCRDSRSHATHPGRLRCHQDFHQLLEEGPRLAGAASGASQAVGEFRDRAMGRYPAGDRRTGVIRSSSGDRFRQSCHPARQR